VWNFCVVWQQSTVVCSLKYLGIVLLSDRRITFCVEHVKVKFSRAFNCIYSRSKGANSELVTVELLKSYCLLGLLYATEAISLTATDIRILDNCISRVLYKIYGVSDNESVLHMRHCLGLPNLMNMIDIRCCKLMYRLLGNGSFTVMCNVRSVLGF